MSSSAKKRLRDRKRLKSSAAEEGIDRISELPEALIIEILSLLPTKENIRTGVLAKKWRHLWTRVPNLCFADDFIDHDNDIDDDDEPLQFVNYVNETLDLVSRSTKVKSLSVDWHYYGFKSKIDSWVRFAVENNIEKLELDNFQGSDGHYYRLPELVFTCSSFQELRLGFCSFQIKESVSWNFLKKLTIVVGGGFTNELLEKIVAGSPALEILDLRLVWGISRLHLGKSGVKKLSLTVQSWHRGDLEEEAGFEILAPTVESLEVSGYFDTCKLVDMKSLIEATFFGLHCTLKHLRDYPDFNQGVLSSVLNVQTLTLGTWVIKGITMLPVDRRPSLSKCKCLTLDTHLWKEDPSAIASLLKCSPEIEILIVTMDGYFSKHKNPSGYDNSYIDQYWTSEEMASINLTCLRTVKFLGFWAYRAVAFPFVKFLLKNARGLQKVIIHLDTKGNFFRIDPTELSGTSEKLLSFPRSSPDAKLLIHQ